MRGSHGFYMAPHHSRSIHSLRKNFIGRPLPPECRPQKLRDTKGLPNIKIPPFRPIGGYKYTVYAYAKKKSKHPPMLNVGNRTTSMASPKNSSSKSSMKHVGMKLNHMLTFKSSFLIQFPMTIWSCEESGYLYHIIIHGNADIMRIPWYDKVIW